MSLQLEDQKLSEQLVQWSGKFVNRRNEVKEANQNRYEERVASVEDKIEQKDEISFSEHDCLQTKKAGILLGSGTPRLSRL